MLGCPTALSSTQQAWGRFLKETGMCANVLRPKGKEVKTTQVHRVLKGHPKLSVGERRREREEEGGRAESF